jgi:hypothetical protein
MRKPSFKCTICSSKNGRDVLTINHPDRFERSIGISNEGYLRSWVECDDCGVVTNILPSSFLEKLSVLRSSYYEVDFMGSDIGAKYSRVMSLPASESDNVMRVARA